jgi:hypothetical protein
VTTSVRFRGSSWRRVALDHHRHAGHDDLGLDDGEQLDGVLEVGERREEDVDPPVAQLDPERGGRCLVDGHHGRARTRTPGRPGGLGRRLDDSSSRRQRR